MRIRPSKQTANATPGLSSNATAWSSRVVGLMVDIVNRARAFWSCVLLWGETRKTDSLHCDG